MAIIGIDDEEKVILQRLSSLVNVIRELGIRGQLWFPSFSMTISPPSVLSAAASVAAPPSLARRDHFGCSSPLAPSSLTYLLGGIRKNKKVYEKRRYILLSAMLPFWDLCFLSVLGRGELELL